MDAVAGNAGAPVNTGAPGTRPGLPAPRFLDEVRAAAAVETGLERCIQCGTCGGSCPSAADMDHTPRALFAMVLAGLRDDVLRSNTPWMCLSCYFCAIRCPQEIHIPDVMYAIKSIAEREGVAPERTGADFSHTFVANIARYGRSYEMGLVARHYLRHHPLRLPGLVPMGMAMLAKGRMGFMPQRIRGVAGVRAILARAGEIEAGDAPSGRSGVTEYLYYPGCSLEGSARAYAESLAAIVEPLGIQLREIDDWNCCGATEYLTLSPLRGHALIGRNLALAEQQRDGAQTLVAPCSACYVNLTKTDRYTRTDPAFRDRLNSVLAADGLHYTPGAVRVRHLLEVLIEDVGLDEIAAHVTRPLNGLRVAPYLGCLVSRPDYDRRWAAREQPHMLDQLLAALGAEVVDFTQRTACCGGHMTQISPTTAWELIRRIVDGAERQSADLLATVCPMCQMNVDAYQGEMDRHFGTNYHVPILFFTQLMGLAFGLPPADVGVGNEIVSAGAALRHIGLDVAPETTGTTAPGGGHDTHRQKRPKGLPMPQALEVKR